MPIEDIRVGVSIAAPGADSNDYVIFDSAASSPPIDLAREGIDRITVGWNNSQACTLKLTFLRAGTTATYDINSSTSLAANAGLTGSPYDFAIVGLGPVQIVVTNGGVAQANWPPVVTMIRGQKASST